MLETCKKLNLGLRSTLELLYLTQGVKPLVRLKLKNKQLDYIKLFCKNRSLSYNMSDYKVIENVDNSKAGFSNQLTHIPLSSDNGDFLIFISKDPAIKNISFSNISDDKLGQLLGYPECCINFFNRNKSLARKYNMDYVPLILKNEQMQAPYLINNIIRYFGYSLISHFPCTYHCENSIKIARKNLEILGKCVPDIAVMLKKKLKSLVIFTEKHGIYYSNTYKREKTNYGDKIKFLDFFASNKRSELYKKVKKRNQFTVIEKNIIKIGDNIYYGSNLRVIEFI